MSSAKRSKLIRPVQWTAKHKSTRCIFFSVINCPALGKELWLPAGFNVIQRAIAGDHQKLWWELPVVFISTGCKMSFKHLNWGEGSLDSGNWVIIFAAPFRDTFLIFWLKLWYCRSQFCWNFQHNYLHSYIYVAIRTQEGHTCKGVRLYKRQHHHWNFSHIWCHLL